MTTFFGTRPSQAPFVVTNVDPTYTVPAGKYAFIFVADWSPTTSVGTKTLTAGSFTVQFVGQGSGQLEGSQSISAGSILTYSTSGVEAASKFGPIPLVAGESVTSSGDPFTFVAFEFNAP